MWQNYNVELTKTTEKEVKRKKRKTKNHEHLRKENNILYVKHILLEE